MAFLSWVDFHLNMHVCWYFTKKVQTCVIRKRLTYYVQRVSESGGSVLFSKCCKDRQLSPLHAAVISWDMRYNIEKQAFVISGFCRMNKTTGSAECLWLTAASCWIINCSVEEKTCQGFQRERCDHLRKGNKGEGLEDCTNDLSRRPWGCLKLTVWKWTEFYKVNMTLYYTVWGPKQPQSPHSNNSVLPQQKDKYRLEEYRKTRLFCFFCWQ